MLPGADVTLPRAAPPLALASDLPALAPPARPGRSERRELADRLRSVSDPDDPACLLAELRAHLEVDALRLETTAGVCLAHAGGPVDCRHRQELGPELVLLSSMPECLTEREAGVVEGWWMASRASSGLRALAAMVRATGHEYRNLVAVQRNALLLVQEDLEEGCLDEEFAAECIDDSLKAGLRSRNLVERLSQLGTSLTTPAAAVDLRDLGAPLLEALERAKLSISVCWSLLPGPARVWAADRELIGLLVDVAENAVTAGASELSLRVVPRGDGRVLVRVGNDGARPAPEAVERAMEPWFTTAGVRERWGLGLAHARLRAERWGGSVELVSTEDGGAEVLLELRKA